MPDHLKSQLWNRPYSPVHLLALLALLLVVSPVLHALPGGEYLENFIAILILVSSIGAVGGRKRTHLTAFVLGGSVLLMKVLNSLFPPFPLWPFAVAGAMFCLFILTHMLLSVLSARSVNAEVLASAVCGYIFIGFGFALLYFFLETLFPGSFQSVGNQAFSMFDAFYFSFITLSTIGYGDILPLSVAARTYAILESTLGLFYCSMLVARLVSMYESRGNA